MPTARDQEQYLMEMLDKTNPSHAAFIEEFRTRMGSKPTQDPKGMKVYRKADETEDYFSVPSKKNVGGHKGNSGNIPSKQNTPTPDREEVTFHNTKHGKLQIIKIISIIVQ